MSITKNEIKANISNFFTPLDISALIGWWDFTDPATVHLTGNNINRVDDKSAAGNHFLQATTANQPPYTKYGGTNDYAYTSITTGKFIGATITQAQPFTIFFVANVKNSTNLAVLIEFDGYTNAISQTVSTYGDVQTNCLGPVADGAGWQVGYDVYFPNKTVTYGWVVNGTVSKYIIKDLIQFTNDVGPSTPIKVQAGSTAAASVTYDIYEILFFNGALSDADLRRVSAYLDNKYSQQPAVINMINFGDSITAGALAIGSQGYAQRVNKYKGFNPYIYAESGQALQNYFKPNYQNALRNLPKDTYITIAFGSNDGAVDTTWYNDYRSAVEFIIKEGFMANRIMLITPPYSSARISYLPTLQNYLIQICADLGCQYVDCVTPTLAGGGDALLVDGTHPNNAGHEIMAQAVLAKLL